MEIVPRKHRDLFAGSLKDVGRPIQPGEQGIGSGQQELPAARQRERQAVFRFRQIAPSGDQHQQQDDVQRQEYSQPLP